MRRIVLALGVCALTAAGCAAHDVHPFRTATIDPRGISIPVPPPSLKDAPEQPTSVAGEVTGLEALEGELVTLHLHELVSDEQREAEVVGPVASFEFDLTMDHSNNCIQLWLDGDDGSSETVQVHTVIADDDQSVDVVPGCL